MVPTCVRVVLVNPQMAATAGSSASLTGTMYVLARTASSSTPRLATAVG